MTETELHQILSASLQLLAVAWGIRIVIRLIRGSF